jgi:NAD(P)-dependent dehydrogenase (short-subunit alcohol dehydrogenase family)
MARPPHSSNEELKPRLTRSLFDLDGRVAVVTGGAGILGRSFVAALSAFGAKVALLDLDAAKAEAIAQNGLARPLAVCCDVDELKAAVERIEGELGPIDILLNNAATKGKDIRSFFAEDIDYALETWREVMAVNIDAMFLVAQEVGRRMIACRKGAIVQTASIYGMLGPDPCIYDGSEYLGGAIRNPAVYSTSKAAVLGLTRHLATVWAPFGVLVNALTRAAFRVARIACSARSILRVCRWAAWPSLMTWLVRPCFSPQMLQATSRDRILSSTAVLASGDMRACDLVEMKEQDEHSPTPISSPDRPSSVY